MPPRGPNTSLQIRKLVISHYEQGLSGGDISQLLNVRRTTVYAIIRRYKREGRVASISQQGQPKKLTSSDERWIRREIEKNPKISAPKLTDELCRRKGVTISAATVRRSIKNMGYNSRTARRKPYISPANIQKRLEFAKQHQFEEEAFWCNVIFTDESKFNLFGSDGKVKIWRRPNTALVRKNLTASVKHGGGNVKVWGCFSASGVGALVFITGNMDTDMYLDILKKNLHSSAEKLGLRKTFHFYQDNDPKHKAYRTREWLLYNCPKVIETPPQSPDCNPIENLWDYLDRKVREKPVSNMNQLKECLQEEWSKIPVDYLQKLVSSMPRRLRAVIEAKGGHTKY